MDGLQNLLKHWTHLWGEWTALQRASVVGGLLLCITLVTGVGIWATRPEFVALADQLTPGDSAEIISALESQGIEYRLNFAGSSVLVPRSRISQARLAIRNVAPAQAQSDETFGSGLWSDPALTQVKLQHDQEQRLARSIMQMRAIRNATVHLTKPNSSPFVRDRAPAKASVILEIQSGADFTVSDAQSIIALVAHSVDGLTAENVTVLDTNGRHLSTHGGVDAGISGQLDYRRHVEMSLSSKAETMLAQWLGPGNAVVRVTAEIDFNELSREETSFDPSTKVKVSEEVETETTMGSSSSSSGGATGTAGNTVAGSRNTASNPVTSKRERNNTQYENTRIVDRVKEAPGRIRRMTVAAVVHPPAAADGKEPVTIEKTAVESIIKQAVGFDAERSDQIEVLVAERPVVDVATLAPPVNTWQQYEGLIRSASLGLGAMAALLLGFLILRRMQPVAVEAPAGQGLSLQAARRLADISQEVQKNPDAAARVLAAWLDETENEEEQSIPLRRAG